MSLPVDPVHIYRHGHIIDTEEQRTLKIEDSWLALIGAMICLQACAERLYDFSHTDSEGFDLLVFVLL